MTIPTRSPTESAAGRLERLARQGLIRRCPNGIPQRYHDLLDKELGVVGDLGYAAYFLTVHDIVGHARGLGILCQGRGSAANSIICWALGITDVSPDMIGMVFERFVSRHRGEPPDIDVDFEHERREEVIQWIYDRYGRDRAGLCATVIHFRSRAAIREVGKVMGLSQDVTASLSGLVWGISDKGADPEQMRQMGLDPDDRRLAQTIRLIREIVGFPRHLSQHVGGFVITRGRLDELCPIENAAMAERTVIEWDKDDIDALNILKVDVLSLGMLTCIRKSFDLLRAHKDIHHDLATVPQGDTATYDMLCRADAVGVFQVESRAQMNFLPRMRPREFYDLVIEVAIVRPGPIQGGMVRPYIRRRQGLEAPQPFGPELEQVTRRTLGVPLFQEQAMQIAIVGAGYSAEEADQLRRSLASFRRMGTIDRHRDRFVSGMMERGYSREVAEQCFSQIEGVRRLRLSRKPRGGLRDADLCVVLAEMPPSGDLCLRAAEFAADGVLCPRPDRARRARARDRGAPRLRQPQRMGLHAGTPRRRRLRAAAGVSSGQGVPAGRCRLDRGGARQRLSRSRKPVAARRHRARGAGTAGRGRRIRRDGADAARCAVAGARDPRPRALAAVCRSHRRRGVHEAAVNLPAMHLGEEVVEDYVATRLTLRAHPMELLRPTIPDVLPHAELLHVRPGRVSVCGLVITRQRPGTASGVIFLTLEDETGTANIVVWDSIYRQFRREVMGGRLLRVTGRLEREGIVVHLIAERIEDLSPRISDLGSPLEDAVGLTRPEADDAPRPRRHAPAARHPREQAKRLFPSRDFH